MRAGRVMSPPFILAFQAAWRFCAGSIRPIGGARKRSAADGGSCPGRDADLRLRMMADRRMERKRNPAKRGVWTARLLFLVGVL